jgi:hypothetical protein
MPEHASIRSGSRSVVSGKAGVSKVGKDEDQLLVETFCRHLLMLSANGLKNAAISSGNTRH